MKLKDILNKYEYKLIKGDIDTPIENITNDSRKVFKNTLFIAEKGYKVDGHSYIKEAINKGASAIIVERDIDLIEEDITLIKVKTSSDALAYVLSKFNKNIWEGLNLTGITGTNGKTSTTYFIKSILNEKKISSGIIGTIGAYLGEEKIELDNTTPNASVTYEILNKAKEKSIEDMVMEVSSHALALNRVKYMEFTTSIFTNLAKDHLDYHETIENYFESKLKLFKMTEDLCIVNVDDTYGRKIVNEIENNKNILTYGIYNKSDVYATDIKHYLSKIEFVLNHKDEYRKITLNIPGEFSIYNALAAASFAISKNIGLDLIKKGLEAVEGIKGRFEVVPVDKDFTVIIDFAHTAEGLDQVLKVIDEFAKARKLVVFGAGGDRDRTKRPEMGEVVASHADISIVTSDNPRSEDPEIIIDDILVGTKKAKGEYKKIIDRKDAIHYALDIAMAGDVILLAGKGHETTTTIGGKVLPFDERKIVLDYLA